MTLHRSTLALVAMAILLSRRKTLRFTYLRAPGCRGEKQDRNYNSSLPLSLNFRNRERWLLPLPPGPPAFGIAQTTAALRSGVHHPASQSKCPAKSNASKHLRHRRMCFKFCSHQAKKEARKRVALDHRHFPELVARHCTASFRLSRY